MASPFKGVGCRKKEVENMKKKAKSDGYSVTKVKNYVKKKLSSHSNIAVGLPNMSDSTIKKLNKYYDVKREPFGYVRFEKKR